MGLSRLFQGANTDFTTEPRPRLLSFPTAAAYLPIHPHPPYSAHAPHTYRTRGIDRPRGLRKLEVGIIIDHRDGTYRREG
jgi:hypothetical protein